MNPRLRFDVNNQTIKRVDDFKVVANSRNYLYAEFNFLTDDWDGKTKTALFTSNKLTKQVVLDNRNSCLVPWEVLQKEGFLEVSLFGGDLITVNVAKVRVNESGYREGTEPEPPTPDVYSQIIEDVDNVKQMVAYIDAKTQIATDDEVDEMLDDIFNNNSTTDD
jgi:hypothetical protein